MSALRAIRVRTSTGWSDLAIRGPKGDPGPPGAVAQLHYSRRTINTPSWGPTGTGVWYPINLNYFDGGDPNLWNGDGQYVPPEAGQYRCVGSWTIAASLSPTIFGVGIGRRSYNQPERLVMGSSPSLIGGPFTVQCVGTVVAQQGEAITLWAGNANGQLYMADPGLAYANSYMEVTKIG